MADPAEAKVLIMSLSVEKNIKNNDVLQALQMVNLSERVCLNSDVWEKHDSIVSIPWNPKNDISI